MACFGGGESKTVQQAAMPEEKEAKKKLLSTYMGEVGKGQAIYPEEWVAGYSPEQKAALSTITKYTDLFSPSQMPLFGQTGETLARTLRGEGGAGLITPEQTEAYYRSVFEEPATRAFRKEIIPAIQESYAGPGYWSSARGKEQTEAAEDLWKYLGTQKGQLNWDVMEANRAAQEAAAQRALSATAPALSYAGLPTQEALTRLGGATDVFQSLGAEQALRQQQINAEIAKFAMENRITDPEVMDILLKLLGSPYGTTTQTREAPGLGYTFLGGGLSAMAPQLGPAFSQLAGFGTGGGMGTPPGGWDALRAASGF